MALLRGNAFKLAWRRAGRQACGYDAPCRCRELLSSARSLAGSDATPVRSGSRFRGPTPAGTWARQCSGIRRQPIIAGARAGAGRRVDKSCWRSKRQRSISFISYRTPKRRSERSGGPAPFRLYRFGACGSALRESYTDQKKEREAAILRLRAEHARLQNQPHDGARDPQMPEELSPRLRFEPKITREIARHQTADRSYLDEGAGLIELAHGEVSIDAGTSRIPQALFGRERELPDDVRSRIPRQHERDLPRLVWGGPI
jgi:hypothetical protein